MLIPNKNSTSFLKMSLFYEHPEGEAFLFKGGPKKKKKKNLREYTITYCNSSQN